MYMYITQFFAQLPSIVKEIMGKKNKEQRYYLNKQGNPNTAVSKPTHTIYKSYKISRYAEPCTSMWLPIIIVTPAYMFMYMHVCWYVHTVPLTKKLTYCTLPKANHERTSGVPGVNHKQTRSKPWTKFECTRSELWAYHEQIFEHTCTTDKPKVSRTRNVLPLFFEWYCIYYVHV